MIISYQHRFIFIHCRKTAGSSICAALAPHLAPEDLMIGCWQEAYAAGVLPNRRMRRECRHPRSLAQLAVMGLKRPSQWMSKAHWVNALTSAHNQAHMRHLGPQPVHPTARQIRDFEPQAWRDFYKFCIVRNPFERAVSDFLWRTGKHGRSDIRFVDFLKRIEAADFRDGLISRQSDNWPMYSIDNRIAVDRVGRFESLLPDLRAIFSDIGLPFSDDAMPWAKRGAGKRDYREWYDGETRALVERLYGREIEAFGYSF